MKKYSLIIVSCFLIFAISSCSIQRNGTIITSEMIGHPLFAGNSNNGNLRSEKTIKTIIEAINTGDRDGIISLFSKEAINSEKFNDAVENMFEYISAPILSYSEINGGAAAASKIRPEGKSEFVMQSYLLETNGKNVDIAIGMYMFNTFNRDQVGLDSVYLIYSDDYYDGKAGYRYIGDNKWTSGIHFDVLPDNYEEQYEREFFDPSYNSEKIVKAFVDACNGKDRGAITQMFAENVRKRVNLDESITRLFEYVGGEITDYSPELDNGQSRALVDEDKTEFVGCVVYKLDTAKGAYHVYIAVRTADSEDVGEEGVYSIHIIKDDDIKSGEPHRAYITDDCPEGIVIG